jgi:hypothetical protein
MTHSGRFSTGEVSLRILGLLGLSGCLLGQDDTGIGWDPPDREGLMVTSEDALNLLLVALAFVGLWKLLVWFLENRRESFNWEKARLWWPTGMVFLGWAMLGLVNRGESFQPVSGVVLLAFVLLNLPPLLTVAMMVRLLDDTFHAPLWAQLVAGSLTMWSGEYLLVRFAEWRAWSNVPVLLRLAEPVSPRTKDLSS